MKQKTLIITGASKGIGRATAEEFVSNDYRVINISRSACTVQGVENLTIDLTSDHWQNDHQSHLIEIAKKSDEICLIHNAAILLKDSTQDLSSSQLASVLALNVGAAADLNQLLIPYMQDGSAILYVSSTLGEKAVANTASYVISKHAVIGQMRATCQDLAGSGISTACVCPGFTDTEMLNEHLGHDRSIIDSLSQGSTFGRIAEPYEIANTLWFCSQNPVINGSVIHANLGQIEN